MSQTEFKTPTYPVVSFLVVRGTTCATVLAALLVLACAAAAWRTGALWLLPAGLAGAGVLLALLLSYVEVLRIIADTLIPKY